VATNGPKVLIEGRPGSGKSTAARHIVRLLQRMGTSVCGFVTDELRERGRRVGFAVESLSDSRRRSTLGHIDLPGPPRVGKYGVDVAAFEAVVLPELRTSRAGTVVVIDEIGKMELASAAFRSEMGRLFAGVAPVVATIHAFAHPFTDELKRRADTDIFHLDKASRDDLPRLVVERLAAPLADG
jgi:nucleoside-triphosphatase